MIEESVSITTFMKLLRGRDEGELMCVWSGTYLDGYNSVQQMVDMSTHLLRKNTPEGVREMAMFLIGFGGVLRGHHLREGDFADFHSVVLENMGYSRCIGLVFVLDHGKTNQSGRLEMAGMIRAKNFLTCPLFALSMHLFYECAPSPFAPFAS